MVKNLPAKQEMQVQSLGREDSLEKEMATHCRILAWEIPWTEEPGGLQSKAWQRVGLDLVSTHTYIFFKRCQWGHNMSGGASKDSAPPTSHLQMAIGASCDCPKVPPKESTITSASQNPYCNHICKELFLFFFQIR